MMIKHTKQLLLTLLCLTVLFACKREPFVQPTVFGILNLNNQTVQQELLVSYNDVPLIRAATSSDYNNIKIPAGSGKLTLKDPSGALLYEGTLDIAANKIRNLLLFQPTPDVKPIILENTQDTEPKPADGFFKVKAANFAPNAFPAPVDMIFYWEDPDTQTLVATDTLENVTAGFKEYTVLKKLNSGTYTGKMRIMDPVTKKLLTTRYIGDDIGQQGKSVYTIYISESKTSGTAVVGSTYKISVKTLFAD